LWVLRDVPTGGEELPLLRETGRWWRFALPWVLIALATDFFFDIDLVALSTLLPPADLAIFGVCARIFSLASFGVAAVYAVNLPEMFEAEALNDRSGFLRRIGDANVVAAGLSLLLFALAGILGPFALLLFGTGFLSGSGPLAVLCLALAVRSLFGPTSLVLSIHDHPYASLPAVATGLVTLIGGNLLLVPPFGLMGASIAALVAIGAWSAILWVVAKKVVGLDVSILPRLMHKDAVVASVASTE
jgi:O-antigen/teichoic acid export membrane protein